MPAPLLTIDSATKYDDRHHDAVVICGSHGGVYPAYLSARAGLRAVTLCDAGIGKDKAGLGCLDYCAALGMAAATVAHDSARIGDGHDMLTRGRISYVNRVAQKLGVAAGQRVAEAAERLIGSLPWSAPPPRYEEARIVVVEEPGRPRVICMDSISLVRPEDDGQIVVSGSHGALLGGKPEAALAVQALAAFFSDAGIGVDDAGVSRLPALETRNIAAACVDTMSARIGDGRSVYQDGVISRLNRTAAEAGGEPGMPLRELIRRLLDRPQSNRARS
ncbi:MAG: hypothetical protein R3349_05735 [Geminicoccaceae bacterium]|nr:hypothetical protein [Geminicoccaceae bacterium]